MARRQLGKLLTLATGTFQRPHPFVYDFVLARGITRCLADVT